MKNFKLRFALLALSLFFFRPDILEAAERQNAVVERALTGDTVRLEGGKELRYAGIEAYSPESKIALAKAYGTAALEFNQTLVAGKKIAIEWGPKLRDKQGRLLGYVFTEDGTFVNRKVLEQGHAKVRLIIPNTRYSKELEEGEMEARRARRGVWDKDVTDPSKLKQYIGEKNTKIFYLPDSPELERIPEAQWVYFNSRVDAKAAGYRACFTCRNKGEIDDSE